MAAKVDAANRRVKKAGEAEFAKYVDRDITPRMQEFAEWLTKNTGYEVDARSVYLSSSLRATFQSSPENQKRIEERRNELVEIRSEAEAARIARKEASAKRKAEYAAMKEAEESEPVKESKPVKKTPTANAVSKKTPATTSAGKVATPNRRRPVRTTDVEEF